VIPLDETNVVGEPTVPLLSDVIASFLLIVRDAWKRLVRQGPLAPSGVNAERTITDRLMPMLLDEKEAHLGLRSWPRIEDQAATRSHLGVPKPEGVIDFKIIFSADEREYFGLECKRVGASDKDLARYYLDEGVRRYVDAKYGPGHAWGGLLAVVVDGDLPAAVATIASWLDFRKSECVWKGDWVIETCFGPIPDLYRSSHVQSGQSEPMRLLHLFVILNVAPAGLSQTQQQPPGPTIGKSAQSSQLTLFGEPAQQRKRRGRSRGPRGP